MSRRTLLYILFAATLVYRGSFFFEIFSRSTLYSGIQLGVVDGRLTVKSAEDVDPFGRKTAAARAGLRAGDRILQFEDARGNTFPVGNYTQFSDALRRIQGEADWAVVVERSGPGGAARSTLPVHRTHEGVYWKDSLLTIFWTSLLPLVAIFTGFFIGFSKPEDDHAFLACLLFVSLSAIVTVTSYLLPAGCREFSSFYESTATVFLPYLFMRFFLQFPSPSWIDRNLPRLKTAFLVFTILLWLVTLATSYAYYNSFDIYSTVRQFLAPADIPLKTGYLSMFVIGLISLILNTFRRQSPDEKRRMVILLAGVAAGIVLPALLVGLLLLTESKSLWLITEIAVSLTVFPAAFAYAVIRHRVLGIRVIVRRGLQYLLVSRGFWIVESALVFLLLYLLARPLLIHVLPVTPPMVHTILIAAVTLALYFTLRRINQPVMRAIDRRFFRQAYDAREILTELSRAIGRLAASPAELLHLITDRITRSLYPNKIAVFLKGYDIHQEEGDSRPHMQRMKTDQYYCVWIQHGHVDEAPQLSQYVFPEQALVPQHIEKLAEPEALEVYLEDPRSWARALVKADSRETSMIQERELLEKLETRLILPLTTGGRAQGIISLGERLSEEPYSKEDKSLLMTVAQQAAIALDYSKLISEVAEQEKAKREMEIARQVQAQLFPQTFPAVPGLDYTGYCRAARGVGGDYYDFMGLKDTLLGIALADISGKGISAALLMAGLQALLRSNAPAHERALDQLFLTVNKLMCSSTARGKYATFFYSVYDSEHRTLDYVNAGHLPPMIFRKNGDVLRLKTGGMVVGMIPTATYKQDRVVLQDGDVLVVYSDGVSEAMNAAEEEFGEERLMEIVRPNVNRPASDIVQAVLSGLEDFVAGAPQHDDITLVIARVV